MDVKRWSYQVPSVRKWQLVCLGQPFGYRVSDQTVKNILWRHGIAPAPKRSQVTSWKDFLAAHMKRVAGVRFLHGGSAQLARAGDLFCIVRLFIRKADAST